MYFHSTPCSICNLSTGRHQTGAQYSAVEYARDRTAVHNVLAQHTIFANYLSSVTREDTIFSAMPQNGDGKLTICLVLSQNKSRPDRRIKVYCCCGESNLALNWNNSKQLPISTQSQQLYKTGQSKRQ